MNDHSDTDDTGDGEGVWSPDIEQCFREALLLFPPCGRRKHILQEEGGGKMYGRNELIARHIRMRTGKIRTRKQVSSHIQVLARRKAKAEAAVNGGGAPAGSDSPTSSINGQISHARMNSRPSSTASNNQQNEVTINQQQPYHDVWVDRPISTQKIRLVEFSAFIEYRQNRQPNMQPGHQSMNDNQVSSSLSNLASAAMIADNMDPPVLSNESFFKSEIQSTTTLNINNSGNIENSALLLTASSPIQASPAYSQQPHMYIGGGNQITNFIGAVSTPNSVGPLIDRQQQPQVQVNHRNQQDSDMSMILTSGANQTNVTNTANNITSNHLRDNISHHAHQQSQHNQQCSSSGFIRHSYVKIDYRMPGGTDGLLQRGPADAFFLVKFWANLNCDYEYNVNDQNSYFGFSCHFETVEPYKDITCSTKACSYGLQVVEKVEKISCAFNNANGRYSYEVSRSPMCEFMIQFIKKLRQLPRASQMNNVLENFTVLQEITCESTSEVLLCLAYVFEVASPDHNDGSQYHVYKLTKD